MACGDIPRFSFSGQFYQIHDAVLEPKPVQRPRPLVYAGGESETARALISETCHAYVMHGDPPEVIAQRVAGAGRSILTLRVEAPYNAEPDGKEPAMSKVRFVDLDFQKHAICIRCSE